MNDHPAAPEDDLPRKVNYGWLEEAWSLFRANAAIWIVATLIADLVPSIIHTMLVFTVGHPGALVMPGLPTALSGLMRTRTLSPLVNGLDTAFSIAWRAFFYGGAYKIAVKQVRGEPIAFGDIFSGGAIFLNMLVFNILDEIVTSIGGIFSLVPTLVFNVLLLPCAAIIADEEGLIAAIRRSYQGMKSDFWSAAGFTILYGLLVVVSLLPCGLGLLATAPMGCIISVLAYRDMVGMPKAHITQEFYDPEPQPGVWPPPPRVNPIGLTDGKEIRP